MSLRDNFSPSTPDIVKEAKLLIHGSEVKYVLTNLHLSCRHFLLQHIYFNWTILQGTNNTRIVPQTNAYLGGYPDREVVAIFNII